MEELEDRQRKRHEPIINNTEHTNNCFYQEKKSIQMIILSVYTDCREKEVTKTNFK